MRLYKKFLKRIENGEPIYCNETFAKDLEAIANKHFEQCAIPSMTPEEYFREWAENCRLFEKYQPIHSHEDMIQFAKDYHAEQLRIGSIGSRLSEMEEAGREATSLIAHLKDQHGFNDEEQSSQDKIMSVFKYEGRW